MVATDTSNPAESWHRAAAEPAIDSALRGIYEIVADEVRSRQPVCIASGRCCHFEAHGHRLYVTGLEAAWCVRSLRAREGLPTTHNAIAQAHARGDCPFLIDGRLCGAHIERPLGCRIYFCDRSAKVWQQELYEKTHRMLVALHEVNAIEYRYGEWRAMLALVV
ncbi:MAG: hypothetical protein SGJ09_05830 [Phycisphaerae bacterium]|nr:hypothetical protein [Phycisphaerae bacterium]